MRFGKKFSKHVVKLKHSKTHALEKKRRFTSYLFETYWDMNNFIEKITVDLAKFLSQELHLLI